MSGPRVSLAWQGPLALALAAAVGTVAAGSLAWWDTSERSRLAQRAHLEQRLVDHQLFLEFAGRTQSDEATAEAIAELGTDPELYGALLVAPDGGVIAGTRLAFAGQSYKNAAADLGWPGAVVGQLREDALSDWGAHTLNRHATSTMIGAIAIGDPAADPIGSRTPVLIVAYDYERDLHDRRDGVIRIIAVYLAVLVTLGGAIAAAFHLRVARRTQRIFEAADHVAAGDFAHRADVDGADELADIGRAVDGVAQRLGALVADIRRAEALYHTVFQAARTPMLVISPERRIVGANAAFVVLSGRSVDEVVGTPVDAILSPAETGPSEPIAPPSASQRVASAPWRLRLPDGSHLPVTVEGNDLPDGPALLALHDLRPAQERERLRARVIAHERLASLGSVAATVGHEINNPLTYLSAHLQLAREALQGEPGAPPADIDALLATAEDGVDRIAHIVRAVRVFSRRHADDPPELFDPRDAVRAAIALAGPSLRKHGTLLESLGECPRVLGDPRSLAQVVMNLLTNADYAIAHARRRPGNVWVSTGVEADGVVYIEVRDDGDGIPAAVLPHVFDPFFTTKPAGQGTGIGLPTSRDIVASMNGRIEVISPPGEGAAFRVRLPGHVDAGEVAPVRTPPPPPDSGPLRLLLVDDEPNVTRALTRLLQGHSVATANSVTEALQILPSAPWDAVICDVVMPQGGGKALFEQTRAAHPEIAARFVFLTGGALDATLSRWLDDSGVPVLHKPTDRATLLQAARRLGSPPS